MVIKWVAEMSTKPTLIIWIERDGYMDLKEMRKCFSKIVEILDELIAIDDGSTEDYDGDKVEKLTAKLMIQLMKLDNLK